MNDDVTYTSGLSAKGALLEETLVVLRQVDQGVPVDEIRQSVLVDDLLGKETRSTRESVWKCIHVRYLNDTDRAQKLARMTTRAPDRQTACLVMFYEFCRANPLLYDVTRYCIYPRYAEGFVGVDKALIQHYLDQVSGEHPEVTTWSPQTRGKIVSNILAILRDFGLLEGVQRKQFARLYVPPPAFVYGLYRLMEDGLVTPSAILEALDWRVFLLLPDDVVTLLNEASALGHCTFKHQGDIYALDFTYPSLEACIAALT